MAEKIRGSVSVIIPAYNGEGTIRAAVESVLAQTHKAFELIIIDDGSKDSTMEILKKFTDPRISIYSFHNAGLPANRNRGLSKATGEFIAFIDQDDLWMPDKLELQLKALYDSPSAGAAYSWVRNIDKDGCVNSFFQHFSFSGNVYSHMLVRNIVCSGSNILMTRAAVDKTGVFDEGLEVCADWDYFIRLSKAVDFVNVPREQVFQRVTGRNMSLNYLAMEKASVKIIKKAFFGAPKGVKQLRALALRSAFEQGVSRIRYLSKLSSEFEVSRKTAYHSLRFLVKIFFLRAATYFSAGNTQPFAFKENLLLLLKNLFVLTMPRSWSNAILKHYRLRLMWNFNIGQDEKSIILLCVIRNERLLLGHFIDHYKRLGVTHFVFIDNDSTDGSREYLRQRKDINSAFYYAMGAYRRNDLGAAWIRRILDERFKGLWCLVVDADELLVLKNDKKLEDIKNDMEKSGSNIANTFLVDLYPEAIDSLRYIGGEEFTSHSCYFDAVSRNFFGSFIVPDGSLMITGGMRKRVFDLKKNICLTKKSFFKYDFYSTHKLSAGYHFMFPLGQRKFMKYPLRQQYESNKYLLFYGSMLLAQHFKFIKPKLLSYFKERIKHNQDWNNSHEYRQYVKNWKKDLYDSHYSLKFKDVDDLYERVNLDEMNKKYIVLVSSARHATTTFCHKMKLLGNISDLGEIFNRERGLCKTLEITPSADNANDVLRLASASKWKEYLLFKLLREQVPGDIEHKKTIVRTVLSSNKIEKVIFLERDMKDSYKSYFKALKTGYWGRDPLCKAIRILFSFVKSRNAEIPSYEEYSKDVELWFREMKKLSNDMGIKNETVRFDDVIKNGFDAAGILGKIP